LATHHTEPTTELNEIRSEVTLSWIKQKIEEGKLVCPSEIRKFCPKCGSLCYVERRNELPRYLCSICDHVFDTPKVEVSDNPRLSKEKYDQFCSEHKKK
jgi:hypothetical protein